MIVLKYAWIVPKKESRSVHSGVLYVEVGRCVCVPRIKYLYIGGYVKIPAFILRVV